MKYSDLISTLFEHIRARMIFYLHYKYNADINHAKYEYITFYSWKELRTIVQVSVRDNNVDQALKVLKKKMQREGFFREMKIRKHYEKPSEKKAREKSEAVRRQRKLDRKREERE